MTYKWIEENKSVRRLIDGACIPGDPGNTDWQDFQKWLAAGNTPKPADPLPSPQLPKQSKLEKALIRKGILTQTDLDAETE